LAMGNAFLCKTDDSGAVFYNPAGLGSVRLTHLHFTNLHFETNKGLLDITTGGNTSDISNNITKGFDLDGTRQLLLDNRGKMTHNRFNLMPNLIVRFMSMGYMFSLQKRATIGVENAALFEFSSRQDHGPFLALNFSLFGGVMKLGASTVYLNRKEIIDERDRDTSLALEDSEYKKGKALVFTTGVRIVFPVALLPTISHTMHNASQSTFSNSGGAGAPDKIRPTQDVGFSLTPQIGKLTRIHFEVNYKDITGEYSNVSSSRKLMLGIEFDIYRVLFVRFGYGDGFGSAGIGLKTRKLEFDLTTYAVDTTSAEFRGEEDRRFSITVSSGI
ncbi:hypothetical protein OAB57_03625, partial [Bacteriovoracaceae bacterium]|nr:hypothetical protein [Bacteriovoracaceae bacterium]